MENKVQEKIAGGALVLDVRTREEYLEEHFKGAKNIPVNEILSRKAELGEKDAPIVVYCASGARSKMASLMLKASGFSDVTNAGGLYDMPRH